MGCISGVYVKSICTVHTIYLRIYRFILFIEYIVHEYRIYILYMLFTGYLTCSTYIFAVYCEYTVTSSYIYQIFVIHLVVIILFFKCKLIPFKTQETTPDPLNHFPISVTYHSKTSFTGLFILIENLFRNCFFVMFKSSSTTAKAPHPIPCLQKRLHYRVNMNLNNL